ncbi:MAG: hypothetical protein WC356_01605 [Candidatus Micrarchaeia archaeon]|jgi:hypothetical protein
MTTTDKIKSTITYQGKSVDLENKAAVEELLTPMFHEIHGRTKPMRQLFLTAELEPKAIELASLVAQLNEVEEDKKASMAAFKEAIDLLKLQIKSLATAINEGMGVRVQKVRPLQPVNYQPVPEAEAAH